MKYFPKRLTYLLTGLAVVTLIIFAFRPTPVRVDVEEIKVESLQVTVEAEGETRLRSRFVVSAPITGQLARIDWDEGDRVVAGDVIARIDPLSLKADIKEAQAKLQEWQAERVGVDIQRPKQEALLQAEARIRAVEAQQQEDWARVQQSQANLEQAKRDRQRAQDLQVDGAISRQAKENAELLERTRTQELQEAQKRYEASIAQVSAAKEALSLLEAQQRDPDYLLGVYDARIAQVQAELEKLTDDVRRTEIVAPIGGEILRVLEESARYVEAGTPLVELGNLETLEIVMDLLSSDAVKVKPGAKVLVENWGGDKTLQAQIRGLEPSGFTKVSALGVEEQRVNAIADFIDSPEPLQDGYRVEVKIVVWEQDNVPVIPLSALFRCDAQQNPSSSNTWCTFVVKDGKAQQRTIQVSRRNNFVAGIEQGLETGEQVILHPTEQIQEGIRVATR